MCRYNFNILINNISFLTNKIKLLSQQTLQHGQEADFGVECNFMLLLWNQMLATALAPFRSAKRSYLGRWNQMVAASWRDNGNNGWMINPSDILLYRCCDWKARRYYIFGKVLRQSGQFQLTPWLMDMIFWLFSMERIYT